MIPTGLWPNSSPENNLPPKLEHPIEELGIQQEFPAYFSPRPRAASNASGAPVRTGWSANSASPAPPPYPRPMPCSLASVPTITERFTRPAAEAACDFRRLPRRFDLFRCLALHYRRVVAANHSVTLGANSIPLPPLPRPARLRRRNRRTRRITWTACSTSIVEIGSCFALSLPARRHTDRRPALPPAAQKEKPRCLAYPTSPAALLLRPLLNG